jgi:uncharacterized protein YgiM (DUF1202 family)
MLRRLVLITMLCATALLAAARPDSAAAYSCTTCAATATQTVTVRSTAHLSGSVLATVAAGSALSWYPASGISADGYVRVTTSGAVTGYAFADYLTLYPLNGTTRANLNLRSGAGTTFSILLTLPSGAAVTVTGGPSNGFMRLDYNGTIGWASRTYLSFVDPNVSWYAGETPRTLSNLRLRSGAGTSYSTLFVLPAGTTVTVLSGPLFANGYSWYRVTASGYGTGYVAGEFLGY